MIAPLQACIEARTCSPMQVTTSPCPCYETGPALDLVPLQWRLLQYLCHHLQTTYPDGVSTAGNCHVSHGRSLWWPIVPLCLCELEAMGIIAPNWLWSLVWTSILLISCLRRSGAIFHVEQFVPRSRLGRRRIALRWTCNWCLSFVPQGR